MMALPARAAPAAWRFLSPPRTSLPPCALTSVVDSDHRDVGRRLHRAAVREARIDGLVLEPMHEADLVTEDREPDRGERDHQTAQPLRPGGALRARRRLDRAAEALPQLAYPYLH